MMIDGIDCLILRHLAGHARASLKDLAAGIPLSAPSTSERLRRLEERGIIRAYTLDVDPALLGHVLQALVRIRPLAGRQRKVEELISTTPEIVECDKVTGEDCFVVRLFARSMEHLDELVERFATEATTNTSIVKSQTIARRPPPIAPI